MTTLRSALFGATAAVALVLGSNAAMANAMVLGSGWQYDQESVANAPTDMSPLTFTLTGPAVFSITDAFAVTDTYTVSATGGALLLTTAPGALPSYWSALSNPTADAAWADPAFSKGQLFFGPGTYSLTVVDILNKGIPAGLYERLDAVPEPAGIAILGVGLLGLGLVARRRS